MASMTEITCKCGCGRKKKVRTADVNRGWGKYYSKSCKARHQESITHQYRDYCNKVSDRGDGEYTFDDYLNELHPFSEEAVQG